MTAHALALTPGAVVVDLGRSLRESLAMFAATLWALVLGFSLSGTVQAFVSRDAMRRRLGNHRPLAVLRASVYGAASSSCSYSAAAVGKSLVRGGADFVAAVVFMVASTNLVVELGVVLVVLLGWQFAAAEFVGGAVMITVLALAGGAVFRGRALEEAQRRVEGPGGSVTGDPVGRTGEPPSASRRKASLPGWSAAARFALSDLKMLRRQILIGYGVAGFLAVAVPMRVWGDLFLRGHGNWTTLENVVVGPVIAMISFVCSIGNVPLAAALWKGGISFAGVLSFLFADLVALPLLLVYRTLYGSRMALRMMGLLWVAMSLAGFVTQALFRSLGIAPATRSGTLPSGHIAWGFTTVLDAVFVVVLALAWYLAHHEERSDSESRFSIDPVCGMQVKADHAPASLEHDGRTIFFCSDSCKARFTTQPVRGLSAAKAAKRPA